MSVNLSRFAINRRGWIIYAIAEVCLFAIANLAAKNSSHPGTISNIAFIAFVIGLGVAAMLAAATVIRHRRAAR
jgi:hypothetical protein